MVSKFQMTDTQSKEIGTIIQKRMNELGYSYRDVEEHTGISVADLFNLVNGKKKRFNIFFLQPLCNFLAIDVNTFLSILGIYTETQSVDVSKLTDEQKEKFEKLRNTMLMALTLNDINATDDMIKQVTKNAEEIFIKEYLKK